MRILILLSAFVFSSFAFAVPSVHSTVNCALFKIDAKASQSLQSTHTPQKISSCKTRMSHGFPIPDPACTPGAINPTVTLNTLKNKQFRTSCVRNHASTEHQKLDTYQWYSITHPRHNVGKSQVCELDHLVSLELGGADTLDNIWPQCGPKNVMLKKRYFKQKDTVENYLAMMVKKGKLGLKEVQKGISTDWTQYLSKAQKACPMGKCK